MTITDELASRALQHRMQLENDALLDASHRPMSLRESEPVVFLSDLTLRIGPTEALLCVSPDERAGRTTGMEPGHIERMTPAEALELVAHIDALVAPMVEVAVEFLEKNPQGPGPFRR